MEYNHSVILKFQRMWWPTALQICPNRMRYHIYDMYHIYINVLSLRFFKYHFSNSPHGLNVNTKHHLLQFESQFKILTLSGLSMINKV